MRFTNKTEAWQCWQQLYIFHGAEPSEIYTFEDWERDNNVTYLSEEQQETIRSWINEQ